MTNASPDPPERRSEMCNLSAGVDREGIVDGYDFETYYRPAKGAHVDTDNAFLAVLMDDGGVDLETRLPLPELVDLLRRAKVIDEPLLDLLRRIEPHLDAIVCYASTMNEHEPNRIAVDVRAALKLPEKVA